MALLRLGVSAVAVCGALLLVACGGGGSTQTPSPTAATSPTSVPFSGGRTPVEGVLAPAATPTAQAALVDVRTADQGPFDRITFEFNASGPNYRVEYTAAPAQCGSGEAVALSPGQAALQVKFTPAVAHDDAGAPTFGRNTLTPALLSIAKVVQSCDFEADVTWIVILPGELDFRATALTNPARLAVDIAHP